MARPKKLKEVVELEQAESLPVTEEQLAELNEGLASSQPETVFVPAINAHVEVVDKKDVVLNGKNYVQVTTLEGVTYLL